MNKKTIQGAISELITLIGSLCFAMLPAETWGSMSGGISALVAISFAIYRHDGIESIFTLVRKFLSLVPAILVQFNLIDTITAGKLIAGVSPLFALVWSYMANNGLVKRKPYKFPIIILCAIILSISLPSCGNVVFRPNETSEHSGVREPLTKLKIRGNGQGGAKAVIDSETIGNAFYILSNAIAKRNSPDVDGNK